MELRRHNFRAMIFYDFKSRPKPDESYNGLQIAYIDEGLSHETVNSWYNEFKRGRLTLRDEKRSGRLLMAVMEQCKFNPRQ